jgi:hypothetical protein
MTNAGGGECLKPLPRTGNLKNVTAPPPPTPKCRKFKIANLKCVFLKNYWNDFLSKKTLRISMTKAFNFISGTFL